MRKQAGASGFLLKDTQPDDLVAAIRTVACGDSVLAPGATTRLILQFTAQQPGRPDGRRADQIRRALTGRQLDVFFFVATGITNCEIAATLHLSEGTVKVHVGRILAKLGLRDRVQTVVRAYESALINPGDSSAKPAPAPAMTSTAAWGGSGPELAQRAGVGRQQADSSPVMRADPPLPGAAPPASPARPLIARTAACSTYRSNDNVRPCNQYVINAEPSNRAAEVGPGQ